MPEMHPPQEHELHLMVSNTSMPFDASEIPLPNPPLGTPNIQRWPDTFGYPVISGGIEEQKNKRNPNVLHFEMPALEKRTEEDWIRLREAYGQSYREQHPTWNYEQVTRAVEGIEITQLIEDLEEIRQQTNPPERKLRELAEYIESRRRSFGLPPRDIDGMY